MGERSVTAFGVRLRQARETRGVPLRHIAHVTKISVRALEAVERNDFSRLPGGIYTRAFVRAYAAEVGLDPDIALAEFLSQCPADVVAVPTHDPETIEPGARIRERSRRLVGAAIGLLCIVILLLAGVGLRWWVGAVDPPQKVEDLSLLHVQTGSLLHLGDTARAADSARHEVR